VVLFAPGAFWQNDLSELTPVPADAMARDDRLRSELGAPDVRYVIAVGGRDADAALQASETLRPQLDALVGRHAIVGYDLAARTCRASRRSVRARRGCRTQRRCSPQLAEAVAQSPFRADVFADFARDVETARRARR
jgi:predicted exporter